MMSAINRIGITGSAFQRKLLKEMSVAIYQKNSAQHIPLKDPRMAHK